MLRFKDFLTEAFPPDSVIAARARKEAAQAKTPEELKTIAAHAWAEYNRKKGIVKKPGNRSVNNKPTNKTNKTNNRYYRAKQGLN